MQVHKILDAFGIEYRDLGNRLVGRCPIHNGDNKNAFCIYKETLSWRCFTAGCHEKNYGIVGLTRLLLKKRGLPASKADAIKIIGELPKIETSINYRFLSKDEKPLSQIPRSKILDRLNIPDPYFREERGFSPEVLIKYDVGRCLNKKSRFYNRAVVPIYDLNHEYMIGVTSRATSGEEPKWLHNNFQRDKSLYNSWFAKKEIEKTNTCILVESPGNIWRLEEAGIHCGLAMYGTALSFNQMRLLSQLGVLNLILALDNDDAGKKATAAIVESLKGLYNIIIPKIEYGDLAECPVSYLNQVMTESLQELLD